MWLFGVFLWNEKRKKLPPFWMATPSKPLTEPHTISILIRNLWEMNNDLFQAIELIAIQRTHQMFSQNIEDTLP